MLRLIVKSFLIILLGCTVPSQVAFSLSNKHKVYAVGPGDTLTINVFGQDELSGTFTVDAEGYVQLPVGDPLRIEGFTLKQTQSLLKDRLADGYVVDPEVSVHISEVRPVIIIGAVRKPGTFPFRFGMSVAEVVALAGGFGGEAQSTRSSLPRLVAAKERLALLNQRRRNMLVRLARADAELSGDDILVPPPQLESDSEPRVLSMIAHQQSLLSTFNEQYQQGLDLIKKQRHRIDVEISAVKKEQQAAIRRTELAKEYLKIQETLKRKGLTRTSTILAAQTAVAEKEGTVAQFDGRLSSLSQAVGALELQAQSEKKARIQRITNEKQNLLAELNEVEVSLPPAERIVELRQQEVGIDVDSKEDAEYRVYLTRRTSRRGKRSLTDLTDSVSPGDILDVRIAKSGQSSIASAAEEPNKMAPQSLASAPQNFSIDERFDR